MAFSAATQEEVWVKRFFDHLGFANDIAEAVLVNYDS